MTLIIDTAGRRVPAGRVTRTLTEPFLTPPLPPWLTVASGTGTLVPPTGSWGYYQITSPAGTAMVLRTAWPFDLTQFPEVGFTLEALHWTTGTAIVGIGLKNAGRGVGLFQAPSHATARVRQIGSGAPDIPVPYQLAGVEATKRRNVTLLVRPRDRELYVLEDDQVVVAQPVPRLVPGPVYGVLDAAQPGGVAMRVSQVKLQLGHN